MLNYKKYLLNEVNICKIYVLVTGGGGYKVHPSYVQVRPNKVTLVYKLVVPVTLKKL